jgi:hypothetical protein
MRQVSRTLSGVLRARSLLACFRFLIWSTEKYSNALSVLVEAATFSCRELENRIVPEPASRALKRALACPTFALIYILPNGRGLATGA